MKTGKDLLKHVRKRHQVMRDADNDNRREGMEDFKFINVRGYQWQDQMKQERGKRPCYEFNKIRVTEKRIINDMRANTPSGKVRATEGGDKEVADIKEGLIRNIWEQSDADTVVDYAAEYQVGAGMGAWRINTKYVSDDVFDQDLYIEEITNPFTLYCDPSDKSMLKKNAQDWILTEKISKTLFEEIYPGKERISFDFDEFDDGEDWISEEEVRVAEYWWKEPTVKEIIQLIDNKVIDSASEEAKHITEAMVKRRRKVDTHKIMMCVVSGDAVLEEPVEWITPSFPFVICYGEYVVIDGELKWHGIGRFAKDAQRSYNVSRTAITETIAMAPQAKYWATPEQAKGHTEKWSEAHKKNFPFMLYNPDPQATGAPQRQSGPDVPVALIQESQLASEEINMVTGIFAADIGQQNQANSGRQEIARQQQGSVATFNYSDNRAKAIKYTWQLLLEAIPYVYDAERELRILGSDGAESYEKVNTFIRGEDGEPVKINDMAIGRYDATITVGPSFSTRRQEASEVYQQLMQGNPEVFNVAGDLIFKSMDLPYSEDIAERLKIMLPPPIQQMINEDQQIPPEVQAMMQQANQAMQIVEQQMQVIQEEANKVEMDKAEVEKLIADLETKKAQFEAQVAKSVAQVAEKDARVTLKGIENDRNDVINSGVEQIAGERAQFTNEMAQAVNDVNQLFVAFQESAAAALDEISQKEQERPKVIRVDAVREKGRITGAVPIYENQN